MPRNLTTYTKAARAGILDLVKNLAENAPLPSLRQLADQFDLHSTTIFRLLHDLEAEGYVWQGPNRRFYPASAQSHTLQGKPICFIGRQIQDWSQLYQEIFEGVTEICTTNGSPLILHSSPTLVQVPVELEPAIIATEAEQKSELQKLLRTIPKGCAGFIFDHLWCDAALEQIPFPRNQCIQLLSGSETHAKVITPNYSAGAQLIADYVQSRAFNQVYLVESTPEEPLLHRSVAQMQETLATLSTHSLSYYDEKAVNELVRQIPPHSCFICTEDNTALGLASRIREADRKTVEMVAIQGTGIVTAPHTRLRYDYRRLGRSAASSILHGTALKQMAPRLVTQQEDD
ncbi:helix-turn-helix domain-containing protein [Coraliomargarita algicola]|uniref:Helix-turn-helix domain-containing protein n=1 Tax=Coraliomargarita algicola TaxID=3092156 RepID=A0ABZ0RJN2_9BACT|nr:helix-turn-helix domain-containing protein [Coraliomargarita sp. J2-16]WPJ95742.1 helix-turn-helix domain-containing protein [Coraliomargarita sp. J2-16]